MPPRDEPSLTQSLLGRAHSPDSVNRIFSEKIQHRPLFLRPSSPLPSTIAAREARRKARIEKQNQRTKKLKPKPLSARERRRLGLYTIPREGRKYSVFEPLNRLWGGYIREILGGELYGQGGGSGNGGGTAAAKLSAADFHGAEIEVSRSRCPSRVGVKGIVVKDSKFVFEVITKKDKVKILPKEGTMFRVRVPPPPSLTPAKPTESASARKEEETTRKEKEDKREDKNAFVFEIHGDQFQYRSSDRANKKFKNHFLRML